MRKSNLKFLNLFSLVLGVTCFGAASSAKADIYRCDTTPGVITLSNVQQGKNCKKMVLPPPQPRAAKPAAQIGSPIPSSVDGTKSKPSKYQSSYDSAISERKRIIQEEMDLERERLDAINPKIATLNAAPNKTAAQSKELVALQKKQGLHQGNLKLLEKEFNKQQ
jgi:Domain of unknown function (DUF4124)